MDNNEVQEIKEDQKEAKSNMTMIIIAIMGSLLAFMFYGRIQDAADIIKLQGEVEQGASERRDIWGKYNDAGAKMMDFMIQDAREKQEIKEEIVRAKLVESERWLEYWKERAQSK